ncbi:D123-domain-containing protein [Rhizoclosmatium globosum]|uniref:D123-domain-containing protein n=1 Tax=Rhizoclosmatium globosum TaxID=329046 RepID=A0A1Y2BXG1_9FUNG|nr:D123-domain-containing protein [Rhizoclosmatium globosum]|eukprot:ORY39354.1 D123-domain-containing protein [Rhizoclosmatium globosum]
MSTSAFPPLTVDHVMNCSFSSWYPKFRRVTLKSEIIAIPPEFIAYLNEDGVFLPLDSNGMPQPSYETPKVDDSDDDNGDFSEDEEGGESWGSIPHFPEFQELITQRIESLGGEVFPKLNWSSPKDASWMALGQTLKCKTPADIFLLLKSSDFITHDLTCPFEACTETLDASTKQTPESYELILRKWYDLHPSMEFRCFVKDNVLIGICQRDHLNFYPFLVTSRVQLESAIKAFYVDEILGKFGNNSFVFDLYINKNNQKVWLIDFNPFSINTDSLLFTWDELIAFEVPTQEGPVENCAGMGLRVVSTPSDSGLTYQPMYATNRMPKDAVDLSDGQTLAEFAQQLTEEVARSMIKE